jgi:hypothetical protein
MDLDDLDDGYKGVVSIYEPPGQARGRFVHIATRFCSFHTDQAEKESLLSMAMVDPDAKHGVPMTHHQGLIERPFGCKIFCPETFQIAP